METRIVLPADETRIRQLHDKLVEYRGRIDPKRPYGPQVGAYYKRAVLSQLLSRGEVDIQQLRRDMVGVHGSAFDEGAFKNACGVIDDYCRTGGANVRSGTSLKGSAIRDAFAQMAKRFLE